MDIKMFEKINDFLNKQPNLDAVYLFGSGARGTMREKSDIDLAILFSTEAGNKLSRFEQLLDMSIALESEIRRHVDMVDIREVPLVLQHQILKYGKCIIEHNSRSRVLFEVDSRRRYFDMKRVYDVRNRALLAGLKEVNIDG